MVLFTLVGYDLLKFILSFIIDWKKLRNKDYVDEKPNQSGWKMSPRFKYFDSTFNFDVIV